MLFSLFFNLVLEMIFGIVGAVVPVVRSSGMVRIGKIRVAVVLWKSDSVVVSVPLF